MKSDLDSQTIPKTQWTGLLVEDLLAALRNGRGDATVRGFATELIEDKQLPVSYLVRKAAQDVGQSEADRLDVLIRGSYVVKQERSERAQQAGGAVKRLLSRFGLRR